MWEGVTCQAICQEVSLQGQRLRAGRHDIPVCYLPTRWGQLGKFWGGVHSVFILFFTVKFNWHSLSSHSVLPCCRLWGVSSASPAHSPAFPVKSKAGPLRAAPPPVIPSTLAGCKASPRTMSLWNFMLFFPLTGECLPMAFTMSNKIPFLFPFRYFYFTFKGCTVRVRTSR